MKKQHQLLLGLGLLSCTCLATASMNQANHHDQHFSIGIQGSTGMGFAHTVSNLISSKDATDLYDDYYFHKSKENGAAVTSLYGVNVGYNWATGQNIWSINLSANNATGTISSNYAVDAAKLELNHVDIYEATKVAQQYNMMLQWKHSISDSTYLMVSGGLSALRSKNTITIEDMYPTANNTYATYVEAHKMTQLGAGIGLGMEYFITENTAFDMSINFFTYAAKSIQDTQNFNVDDSSKPEFFKDRKSRISLTTISAGYQVYF